jgi:Carboxypeptidase regulatory-like domain
MRPYKTALTHPLSHILVFLSLSFSLSMILTPPIKAQTPDTATLQGLVTDEAGADVSNAAVTVRNSATGTQRAVETDGTGHFEIPGLPIFGTYSLTVKKTGFATGEAADLSLIAGTAATVKIELNIAEQEAEVTVNGTVGEVRSDEPQLGIDVSATQAQEMPLYSRRITYLPLLESANRPAINQGDVFMNEELFTTNGAGRRQTWFEIDGSNAVDTWGRQTIFTDLPVDSIQEMTVLTNAFSAQYGLTAGSVINIVTNSGSKDFHGHLLFMDRPSEGEAKLSGFSPSTAASGNDITSDSLQQGALGLSGPVGARGRTFFATDWQYSFQKRASPVTSPIAPGNFIGQYQGWLGFIRLDHELTSNNRIFIRGNADSFYDTNPNGAVGGSSLPSVDRIFKRRTYAAESGDNWTFSPSLLNSVRMQFQLASPITEFDPSVYRTEFVVPVSTGGTFQSGTSQSALLQNRQYEVDDVVSAVRSRHTISFGADWIHAHNGGDSKEYGGPIFLGEFKYDTCTQAAPVCESPAYLDNINNVQSYTQSFGNAGYTVDDTLASLFVQDDYRMRRDLTVNLGLRYQLQTFTDSTRDFAPRLGFAYDLLGGNRTVIRGGFGIYYSQIVDNSEANYALTGPTGVFNYTATPGQVGFPSSVSAAPLTVFPAGAQIPLRSLYIRPGESKYLDHFFPTSVLAGYPTALLNPYTEQWTLGVEQQLPGAWMLTADYIGSHTVRINRPLDVDPPAPYLRTAPNQFRGAAPNTPGVEQCIPDGPIGNTATTPLATCAANAANATRPLWIYDAARGIAPAYSVIQSDVNDGFGFYDALDVDLSRRFENRISFLASYTWSHAIDNVDPDVPQQNPDDPNFTGRAEKGNAIYDQRNRFVLSGFYTTPWKFVIGGIGTFGSGMPYNIVTGTTNSGDTGATTDRPVLNGVVVDRNSGHGQPTYTVDAFVERPFQFTECCKITVRAEAFNVLNHANFVGYSGTWGNGPTPGPGFGEPLAGVTNQLPAREFQFSAAFNF